MGNTHLFQYFKTIPMYQSYTGSDAHNRNIHPNNLFGRQHENSNGGMQIIQLIKLFDEELRDIYWAEKALTRAIPKLINNATSDDLIDMLEDHMVETIEQVRRLELIFEIFGKKAVAKKCGSIDGLLREVEGIMESSEEGAMCDAGIISVMQKVAHYEIASYGILWQFAKTLGMTDVVLLIQTTLDEEKAAEERLTDVADNTISVVVSHDDDEELVEAYGMWL